MLLLPPSHPPNAARAVRLPEAGSADPPWRQSHDAHPCPGPGRGGGWPPYPGSDPLRWFRSTRRLRLPTPDGAIHRASVGHALRTPTRIHARETEAVAPAMHTLNASRTARSPESAPRQALNFFPAETAERRTSL